MSIAFLTIGLMLLIVAPITWFSDWWRTPVVNWWRRIRHAQLTALPVLNQPDEDLERFRACQSHIEQCKKLVGPFASPLSGLTMGLQYLSAGGTIFVELLEELGYLMRKLDALGIRYPAVYGPKDESSSDFRMRMRIWNMYLAELAVMIRYNDLVRARQLEPLDPTKLPTSDKSDAL